MSTRSARSALAPGQALPVHRCDRHESWHMLVADDYHLETSGCDYRPALFVFFVLCATAGGPLSWNMAAEGDIVSWVGFELLHRFQQLGISQRRAEWFSRSTRYVATAKLFPHGQVRGGPRQRCMFWGALDYERHFLVPPHKVLTIHPRGSVRRVPAYILSYLSLQTRDSTHCACAEELARMMAGSHMDWSGRPVWTSRVRDGTVTRSHAVSGRGVCQR